MPGDATIVSGRRVADRYRLVDERADHTWTAVDETLRRTVVVHLLPADADGDAKEHFTAEARSLARLNHRNIVCTYDTGVDGDGTSYRVDELAVGTPLDLTNIEDQHRVPVALQVVRAIADAHDAGLAHGSLGSHSVLIDDTGRVQLRGLRLPPQGAADELQRADLTALVELITGLAPPGAAPLRDVAVGWRRSPPASARTMVEDVAAIPDDTLDTIPPHVPTPAIGVPDAKRRSSAPFVIVIAALVVAAIVVAVVVPASKRNSTFGGPAAPLHVTAKSFDPQGRPPTEDEADAHLVLDGNTASTWKTERYHGPHFGHLKDGVGLILVADGKSEFDDVTITSPSRGWTVEIYVADQPATALSGWGRALASADIKRAATTLGLNSATGGALLIWITDPGPARQVRISDVTVLGKGSA